jgi:hypothetical protein
MALGWGCLGEDAFSGLITKLFLATYGISCVSVNIPAGAEQMRLLPGLLPFNTPKAVSNGEIELLLGGE